MATVATLTQGAPVLASAPPAECPWCRVPLLEGAFVALSTDAKHPLFDDRAVNPDALAAANAARVTATAAAAAWRAQRLVELLPAGALPGAAWANLQADARHTMRTVLVTLATAVTVGPRQTEAALYAVRDAAAQLRGGVRSLSAMIETRRVCRAIDVVSDAMQAHVADAGVVIAGAVTLAGTGIWAARRPQSALAAALAAHADNAVAARALCSTATLFTRSRLSSSPQARALGDSLTTTLARHAANAEVAPIALTALRNVIVHLSYAERLALDESDSLFRALDAATAAASARNDILSASNADVVRNAIWAARYDKIRADAEALITVDPDARPAEAVVDAQTGGGAGGDVADEVASAPRQAKRRRVR